MLLLSLETEGILSLPKKEADLFKLGNLVRHRSGGPIMVVDQDVFVLICGAESLLRVD